ncbi:hypothetical protein Taro_015130 [Colocasia esculenta]|uniref:Uncharacterized protein n=1 Tax=Colocasia esculenta TaxID=4460 RepID=A0A843UGJ9_COLES|nr:hypothetical protein [Colocasia esculenta]
MKLWRWRRGCGDEQMSKAAKVQGSWRRLELGIPVELAGDGGHLRWLLVCEGGPTVRWRWKLGRQGWKRLGKVAKVLRSWAREAGAGCGAHAGAGCCVLGTMLRWQGDPGQMAVRSRVAEVASGWCVYAAGREPGSWKAAKSGARPCDEGGVMEAVWSRIRRWEDGTGAAS